MVTFYGSGQLLQAEAGAGQRKSPPSPDPEAADRCRPEGGGHMRLGQSVRRFVQRQIKFLNLPRRRRQKIWWLSLSCSLRKDMDSTVVSLPARIAGSVCILSAVPILRAGRRTRFGGFNRKGGSTWTSLSRAVQWTRTLAEALHKPASPRRSLQDQAGDLGVAHCAYLACSMASSSRARGWDDWRAAERGGEGGLMAVGGPSGSS